MTTMKAALALLAMAFISGAQGATTYNHTACVGDDKFQVLSLNVPFIYGPITTLWTYSQAARHCGAYIDDAVVGYYTAAEESILFPLVVEETWIAKDSAGGCRTLDADGNVATVNCNTKIQATLCRFTDTAFCVNLA
ncbi:hypothetical protein DIPPA_19253 [Diplonema papillatum]|nr:hypothetical protein DIPPA_19253 [Diplonema papillatum]